MYVHTYIHTVRTHSTNVHTDNSLPVGPFAGHSGLVLLSWCCPPVKTKDHPRTVGIERDGNVQTPEHLRNVLSGGPRDQQHQLSSGRTEGVGLEEKATNQRNKEGRSDQMMRRE